VVVSVNPNIQCINNAIFKQKIIHVSEGKKQDGRIFRKYSADKVRDHLHAFGLIGINTAIHIRSINFDVDRPTLYTFQDESPTAVMRNKTDGKFHVNYTLENPFNLRTPKLKRWYNEEIKPWIKNASILMGADGHYTNQLIKNPNNTTMYDVQATGILLRSAFDILNPYQEQHHQLEATRHETSADNHYLSQPFKVALQLLREHSLNNLKLCYSDVEQYEKNMYTFAFSILQDQVKEQTGVIIKSTNIDSMVKDTISYTKTKTSLFSIKQSARGKLANSIRWGNQVEKNTQYIKEAIIALNIQGTKPTYKAISLYTGMSEASLKIDYKEAVKAARK